jgi:hypothetical protein
VDYQYLGGTEDRNPTLSVTVSIASLDPGEALDLWKTGTLYNIKSQNLQKLAFKLSLGGSEEAIKLTLLILKL